MSAPVTARRFTAKPQVDELVAALSADVDELFGNREEIPASEPVELLGGLDPEALVAAVAGLEQKASELLAAGTSKAKIDGELVKELHGPLADLPRQTAADPLLWTWLACGPGRGFVWLRWGKTGTIPASSEEIEAELNEAGSAVVGRFRQAGPSLNAVSRHALARLWWLGASTDGDYDAAQALVNNQDAFQAIFERDIGTVPSLGRLLVEEFGLSEPKAPQGKGGKWFREEIMKTLSQLAAVTRLEALEEDDLRALVVAIREEKLAPF